MQGIPDPSRFSDLGVSVVASLLAVSMLALGRLAWAKIGEDLWLRLAWRHLPDISGEWRSTRVLKYDYSYDELMIIRQSGWKISGEIEYREYDHATEQVRLTKTFVFEGNFKERVVAVTYQSKNRKSLSTGTALLFLKDDNTFSGGCAYYDPDHASVATDKYYWNRVN